ncbi:pyridoxal phosphate-dependent transferase [Polychytrium aggregatum]|uniref:pyridoxal phosphate-dependent transferase n=1 Tax=Polychytrium aggregatum TaxID=110093 RepID=UPI0022FEE042|nr:pyridoxal phosphate-dependent transferase [Polychytrium aggregatum]KAI9208343.1 pyridoxal phosphate-dependent transferase [Polychytrium aggregatum]
MLTIARLTRAAPLRAKFQVHRGFSSMSCVRQATHLDKDTHASTAQRLQEDSKVLLSLYGRPSLIFTHGQGVRLFDLAGRSYLDMNAGIAVNALGHNHPQVTKVISEQAQKLIHLSNLYHNENAGDLARLLVAQLNGRGKWSEGAKVFLCNSGTEANEAAIKFARKYGKAKGNNPNKDTIVSFSNAFHGRSLGALSATPNPKYQAPFAPLIPHFVHGEFNNIAQLKDLINENTCGVFVEPVQGEGGIHPSTHAFLKALRERCDEVGAVLVFDEIQCGLGRLGSFYAHQQYDITPDIVTIAKPIANGLPVGATIVSEAVASVIKPGDHGTTFGGSPFASAVAKEVCSIIQTPQFLQGVHKKGVYLLEKCKEAAAGSKLVAEVRGKGLMVGIQLNEGVSTQTFVDLAREHGVLVISAGCNTVRLVPPLIIQESDIDEATAVFKQVLQKMEQ